MRKNAGFMIMTLLLLAVPALANAWNLTVKVAGGDTTNFTTVSYGSTHKDCQSGTFYLYPQTAVTLAETGAVPTLALDGVTKTLATFVSPTSGSHTLVVTYPAAVVDTGASITLTQNLEGGQLYAQNRNNTWSYTGVSGLANLSSVPVYIIADGNHKIVSYDLGTGPITAGITGAAGQSLPVAATATTLGTTVNATFAIAGTISASLFTPTVGTSGTHFNVTMTATSNDTGLLYSFSSDNGATFSTPSGASSHSFTLLAGSYSLVGKVTSTNGGTYTTPAAAIVIADAAVVKNQGCTSCHSTQPSAITGPTPHDCTVCHTAAPHAVGTIAPYSIQTVAGQSPIVNATTFLVMSTNVKVDGVNLSKGDLFCTACHKTPYAIPHQTANLNAGFTCSGCHTSATGVGGTKDLHSIQELSCIGCHAVGQKNPFSDKTLVNDNNGVRSITNEFGKWSHHVTGVDLQDAHCVACHLEGKVSRGKVVVDSTKHMADNMTHLRNADDDSDMQWDPAAPNHSTMDNFCLSCHDANGATSAGSIAIQAVIVPASGKTASPSNPFGDTISNQYDKMERPAVVDANGQFNTGNSSHHAVLGKKYSGRQRVSKGGTIVDAAFTANSSATLPGKRQTIFDAGKFVTAYTTLANDGGEAGARNGGSTVGDDSTLHCGDCHTVGQWKQNAAKNADGTNAPAAIGAHGSNNEYLLRNMVGTDAKHIGVETQAIRNGAALNVGTAPYLVCFNCHKFATYGEPSGASSGHAGEHIYGNTCNGPFNTSKDPKTGEERLESQVSIKAGYDRGAEGIFAYGATYTTMSNMFNIQCNNCHNSGIAGNMFGGIHGSKVQTYTDGMGNQSKHRRFMPGLGNTMFVPGTKGGFVGGTQALYKNYSSNRLTGAALRFTELPARNTPYATGQKVGSFTYTTGGVSNDTNWEQKSQQPVAGQTDPVAGAMGCYTLAVPGSKPVNNLAANGYPADDVRYAATEGQSGPDGRVLFDNWGGCDDHGAQTAKGTGITRNALRPVSY